MNDLYSAGLRIDLAYLLGVAVFDTDHVYLLYVETNKKTAERFRRKILQQWLRRLMRISFAVAQIAVVLW